MGFQYKAIFVDLDGTLLNSRKVISKRSVSCLNKLIELGIHVVISTGRTLKSVRNVTREIKLTTPVITLNGSDIKKHVDDGYSMMLVYLDNKLKRTVVNMCKNILNNKLNYSIQNLIADTASSFYCLRPHYLNSNDFSFHYDNDVKEFDVDNPFYESVVSFLFLLTPESDRRAFLKEQSELLKPYNVSFCTFNGWPWIELGSSNMNKGIAMQYVCDYLGIHINEAIAFGDGENDVEMLSLAGLGVAMANADEHALNAAKIRTLSNDEDGVAVFLEKLFNFGI
jgi:Cof subfamily protein (haloacid dehalogenase superfamily)